MAAFYYFSPTVEETGICPDDVLEMLHEEDRSVENPVVSDILEIFGQLNTIAEIRGGYSILNKIERNSKTGEIKIEDQTIKTSPKICKLLEGTEQIAVFICTAGRGFSDYAQEYNRAGDYLKGYIVDTFGSTLVEKSMDFIQAELERLLAKEGLQITNRYSPGYCNWPVDDQKQLFSLLPRNECAIELSDSCLMVPVKSVSGIIGIGKNVRKSSYSCDICNNQTCIYRRVRHKNKIVNE